MNKTIFIWSKNFSQVLMILTKMYEAICVDNGDSRFSTIFGPKRNIFFGNR